MSDSESRELVIDNFAGGGGASEGIEKALGQSVDFACNHDRIAVQVHKANHPNTNHLCQDIWSVDPMQISKGRPIGLAWFSPDCRHFSKAKGKAKVSPQVRDLAWVVVEWAKTVRPRVIMLENVEEFKTWGPLVGDRPCPKRKGVTFNWWVQRLERFGYEVQFRELKACDYGVPTTRKRLFMIARCDGEAITWPTPTHGPGLQPYRTAAEIIDWSQPVHSIFLSKEDGKAVGVKRPLAENTQKRIARGIRKYVMEAKEPFVVTCNHGGDHFRGQGLGEPFKTVCASRDAHGLVAPTMIQTGYGERKGQKPRTLDLGKPLGTVVAGGAKHALCAAFMARHWGGMYARDLDKQPWPTTTTRGSQDQIVTSNLIKLRGTCKDGQPVNEPVPALTAGGNHVGEVRAFLTKYYSSGGQDQNLNEPMHTLRTKACMGLVTVAGEEYQIADIGMRMLTPRELFRAQGFRDSYIIDREYDGTAVTKTHQIRLCGNSVPPRMAEVLVRSNFEAREIEHSEVA